jgi:hypothetical protein
VATPEYFDLKAFFACQKNPASSKKIGPLCGAMLSGSEFC